MRLLLLALLLVFLATAPAAAQIANGFPNDVGMCNSNGTGNHADIVWCDMFSDSIASILTRWTGSSTISGTYVTGSVGQSLASAEMALSTDIPPGSSGSTRSLRTRATGSSSSTVQLSRDLAAVCSSCTELWFRYYVKYSSTTPYHHAGLWIIGQNPKSAFLPSTCCDLPVGNDRFYVGSEIPAAGQNASFDLYSGWMGMRDSGITDQQTCGGLCYFGNTFIPDTVTVTYGAWHLAEVRIKMNTIGQSNGEMQAWLDGVEVANLTNTTKGDWNVNIFTPNAGSANTFGGFQWRSTSALELAKVLLNHYSPELGMGQTQDILWSNLVVARSRVGGIATSSDTVPPTAPSLLRSTSTTSYSVVLAATGSTDNIGVTTYNVERSPSGCASYVQVGTSPTPGYTDTTVSANTAYCYRMRAGDAAGNFGAYSNQLTLTTLASQVLFFRFVDAQADGTNQETGFVVNRKAGASGTWASFSTPGASSGSGSTITVQDTSAPSPTSCYQVEAVNAFGNSGLLCGDPGCCFTQQPPSDTHGNRLKGWRR